MKIKWIFFDIGGVLTDESEFLKMREDYDFETLRYFQPEITNEEVLAIWPKASEIIGDLDVNIISLLIKDKNNLSKAIKMMKEKRSKIPGYYDLLEVRSEAKDVLEILSKKYKLGILANQGLLVKEKFKEADILKYFTNTDVSDDYKLEKPNLELFRKIFEITGADPKESVIVDDNIERGLSPGKKFGMTTVWYKLKDREVPQGIVDYTLTSLNELQNIF